MTEIKQLPVSLLDFNKGQLQGLPKNPRFFRNHRYEAMKKSIQDSVLKSKKFKQVFDERKAIIKSGVSIPIPVDEIELVGTDEVLKEILRSAKQQPSGSKERADLFAKYNDIKKESEQTSSNVQDSVLFAFPIKCYQCPLLHTYNEYRKENGEKELKPVEMERVIKLADDIIKKAMKKK